MTYEEMAAKFEELAQAQTKARNAYAEAVKADEEAYSVYNRAMLRNDPREAEYCRKWDEKVGETAEAFKAMREAEKAFQNFLSVDEEAVSEADDRASEPRY